MNNSNLISTNTPTSQDQTKSTASNERIPRNCTDLQLFGYSLNGFYFVAPNEGSKIETIYCDFQKAVLPDLKGNIITTIRVVKI